VNTAPLSILSLRIRQLIGVVIVLLPIFPLTFVRAEVKGLAGMMLPQIWILSIFILLTLSWLLSMFLSSRINRWSQKLFSLIRQHHLIIGILFILLVAAAIYLISAQAFNHRPHLVDTIGQLFHAKIFAAGKLYTSAPTDYSFFMTPHMVVDEGRFYSQYPPGHIAVIALGLLFNMPWLFCIALAAGSLPLLYLFVRDAYDRDTATLATFLLGLSPFFLFMSGSYMNHITELFFVLLALRSFQCWEQNKHPLLSMSILGISGGILFLVRPFTAIIVGVVFLFLVLPKLFSNRIKLLQTALGALSAMPFALFMLYYNAQTTGSSLLPGYTKLWGHGHGLGFHIDPWGDLHTPLRGILKQTAQILELNEFLFEFPFPALIPLGALLIFSKRLKLWDLRLLLFFLTFPVAYIFYWHRDSFLGPRFLYVTIAFLIPLTASALVTVYRWSQGKTIGLEGILKPVNMRVFFLSIMAISYLYLAFFSLPPRYKIYSQLMRSFKIEFQEDIGQGNINQGLIFVAVSWGHRIISQLRGAGISASLVQAAYRKVDSCDLQHLLLDYQKGTISQEILKNKIENLLNTARPVSFIEGISKDKTLRFWENRKVNTLTPECVDELEYDQMGFTNYAPFFADNNPNLSPPFVFATDLRSRNLELISQHPELKPYLYRGKRLEAL